MDVEISCEVYARMAEIPMSVPDDETRTHLRCVFLERRKNQLFIVVTNAKIAAIELLGTNAGPDETAAIIASRALIDACENETKFDGTLRVVTNPALGFTAIKTKFGFVPSGNCAVVLPPTNEFQEWRTWLPDTMPKKSNGAMFWNTDQMKMIATASISGTVKFPAFIDVDFPVVINDFESDKWIGVFVPTCEDGPVTPATIPAWMK